MICDGPQSRLTKSTDAAIATGSSQRFIGSSLKTPLIAVSWKFSFGSWNQWAISKEILPRILRKYFPPFKKRAHEDCPHFKSRLSHPRMKLAAGRVRDAPLGTLVYAALLIVYDLILVITPWDINSMSTQRPEHSNGRPEGRRKGPSIYWLARLGPQLKKSLARYAVSGRF